MPENDSEASPKPENCAPHPPSSQGLTGCGLPVPSVCRVVGFGLQVSSIGDPTRWKGSTGPRQGLRVECCCTGSEYSQSTQRGVHNRDIDGSLFKYTPYKRITECSPERRPSTRSPLAAAASSSGDYSFRGTEPQPWS